ncbi:hypothetical protein SUGI_0436150 [Cryptomeria japonica]|nr:hypothetical protein SUGI_0436150 [Cryptomeria japonica]
MLSSPCSNPERLGYSLYLDFEHWNIDHEQHELGLGRVMLRERTVTGRDAPGYRNGRDATGLDAPGFLVVPATYASMAFAYADAGSTYIEPTAEPTGSTEATRKLSNCRELARWE